MPGRSGRRAGLVWADGTTTNRNISSYLNSISFPQSADPVELTTFNSTQDARSWGAGLIGRTISFEGVHSTTVSGWLNGAINKSKAFTYYPVSTAAAAAGYEKWTGNGILNSYEITSPVGGAVGFSCEGTITGAVTRSTAA